MFIFYEALKRLFQLIEFLILVRIIMRFININPNNLIGKIVYELTDPILLPAKALLNMVGLNRGMLDFSPILAMLLLRGILTLVFNMVY
ncbi:MAG: YggT family protein [Tissierellia bacterium]|jgi:YggT family protein|nr:YggT family protein [Tissierellia bacterium]